MVDFLLKATIGDWSKLKAKCYWHGAATDIQDEVSHLDENSVKFGNKEIYCALAKFLVLIIEHTEGLFKSATERLPNFPILGLLWKGVSSWRWQILEVNVWKNIPKPSRSISWADGHDMLLSNKGCVWYITHDKRQISPNDLRRHNVKISACLFPKHNLGKH